jgi:CRISPR/Cas system CSM-associated protein Csm5 (group 7 of RAMP superfamily)
MKNLVSLSILSLTLIGCGEENIKSVDYYLEHKDEIKTTLEKCEKIEDRATNNNCINASKANAKSFSNSMFGDGVNFE